MYIALPSSRRKGAVPTTTMLIPSTMCSQLRCTSYQAANASRLCQLEKGEYAADDSKASVVACLDHVQAATGRAAALGAGRGAG